jgi:hypothetical protein
VIATALSISLMSACDRQECATFAFPLHQQLATGYETCSVLAVPESVEGWREEHRTARKRASRAERLGYRFSEIAREEYDRDIFEINTSLGARQGRPMSAGYRERVHFMPLPEYRCARHAIRTYGVMDDRGTLVAYLWLYRSGELALVSSILGHGEHLANDVMYLLFQGVVGAEAGYGGYFVYNRHDSGTEGLRYFKGKLGFEATEVEWAL